MNQDPMLPRAEINVTPMVDVMFVLLMIFMIAVPAISSLIALPVSVYADSRPEEPDEIILQIDQRGVYALEVTYGPDVAWAPSRVFAPDQLPQELLRLYSNRTRDRILYLKADSALPFGRVETAIDMARRAGVRVVGAVTERRPGPGM